jgi:hypothetical protein
VSRRQEPWPDDERLAWQIRWHQRKAANAKYWLEWAHLPDESRLHWDQQRRLHLAELDRLLCEQLRCT